MGDAGILRLGGEGVQDGRHRFTGLSVPTLSSRKDGPEAGAGPVPAGGAVDAPGPPDHPAGPAAAVPHDAV